MSSKSKIAALTAATKFLSKCEGYQQQWIIDIDLQQESVEEQRKFAEVDTED